MMVSNTATNTLTMKTGQDTDIIGSIVSGNKVNVDVGGNLNIQSQQTKKDYNEESTTVGGGFSVGGGKTSYSASASKGNMDSNYESVTEQAGIQAGKEGFDINVKDNTHLQGGVIASDATLEMVMGDWRIRQCKSEIESLFLYDIEKERERLIIIYY